MTARRAALLLVTCLAVVLGHPGGVAYADGTLAKARVDFLRTRDTCTLVGALTGPDVKADERAVTDGVLAAIACNQMQSPPSTGGVGYDALPAFVVALKGMNLDVAEEAAAAIGDRVAGGIGRWAEALVLARRGRDGQAVSLVLAPQPGDDLDAERVLFPMALLGQALAEDDRLLLAAIAREAIFEACRQGLLDRVVPVARRAAALDWIIGARCARLAIRALRRSGRLDQARALDAGPETERYLDVHACWVLENAVHHWRAGDPVQARKRAEPLANGSWNGTHQFVAEALQRVAKPIRPAPLGRCPLQVRPAEREVVALARFANLLGSEASPGAVEAAALAGGLEASHASFARTYLESLGNRVVEVAGSPRTVEYALRQGLPFLLYRVRLRGHEFVEEPIVVRARDPSTGLWIVDPMDLRDPDALRPDAHVKARMLVAAPGTWRQDPSTWASGPEKALGKTLTAAMDLAARGDEEGATGLLEAQTATLGAASAFQLYLGYLYHRRALSPPDPTLLQLARDAVERSLKRKPELPFEHFTLGWALWVFHESRDDAILAYERAQRGEPDSPFLAEELYSKYLSARRTKEALEEVMKAHVLDPRDTAALFQRATLREKTGDVAGAWQDLRRAFDRRPEQMEIALALVRLERDRDRARAVLRVIDEFVERVPEAHDSEAFRAERQWAEMRLVEQATTVEALEAFLGSPLSDTRRRVGYQLARLESPEAERVLRRLLEDPHRAVRVTTLRIYMRPWLRARVETDEDLFARVVALLHDDEEPLVRGAVAGLLSLVRREEATKEIVGALVGASRDPDPYVRSEAASALDEKHHDGGLARQALVTALGDEDVTVRRAAIRSLFRLASTYHGYDPEAPPEERTAAIERWKRWLAEPR